MAQSGNPFSWKEAIAILGAASAVIKILDWLDVKIPSWLRRISVIILTGSVLFLVLRNSLASPWSEILLLATGGVCGTEIYRSFLAMRNVAKRPSGQFEEAAAYNGFGYEEIGFCLDVLEDRSAILKRQINITAFRMMSQTYQYVFIPTAEHPSEILDKVKITVLEKPTPNTHVDLEKTETSEGTTVFLSVTPPLESGQALKYELVQTIKPNSIALLQSQLELDREDNTLSYDITWPTRKLVLTLLLPEKYQARHARMDVWRRPLRITVEDIVEVAQGHQLTTERVHNRGQTYIQYTLSISQPRQGFSYVLRWTPVNQVDMRPSKPVSQLPVNSSQEQVKDKQASQSANPTGESSEDEIEKSGEAETQITLPSKKSSQGIHVFLCYGSDDRAQIREISRRLREDGFDPWLDQEKLLPGQERKHEIQQAISASDAVLVLLSRSFAATAGFMQSELKLALDVADEQPEGAIFLVPVKLEDCIIPDRLKHLQWVNLYEDRGWDNLVRALKKRADDIAIRPV